MARPRFKRGLGLHPTSPTWGFKRCIDWLCCVGLHDFLHRDMRAWTIRQLAKFCARTSKPAVDIVVPLIEQSGKYTRWLSADISSVFNKHRCLLAQKQHSLPDTSYCTRRPGQVPQKAHSRRNNYTASIQISSTAQGVHGTYYY